MLDWLHLMEHLDTVVQLLSADGATWHITQQTALLKQSYRTVARALITQVWEGSPAVRAAARACLHYIGALEPG